MFAGGAVGSILGQLAGVALLQAASAWLLATREARTPDVSGTVKEAVRERLTAKLFELGPGACNAPAAAACSRSRWTPSSIWTRSSGVSCRRSHRGLLFAVIVTGAGHQLLLLGSAGTGAWLVAEAATGASAADLQTGLIVLAVLIVPLALMNLADTYFAHMAAFYALADVRGEVYAAFARLAPAYMLARRSGDLGSAAISDVEQIKLFFAHTLSPLAVAATVPLATVIALVMFHWALALAFVPALVLLATVPSWLRRRAEAQGRDLREALET